MKKGMLHYCDKCKGHISEHEHMRNKGKCDECYKDISSINRKN